VDVVSGVVKAKILKPRPGPLRPSLDLWGQGLDLWGRGL